MTTSNQATTTTPDAITESLATILKVLVLTPTDDGMGAPAMFWGPPGVGKTAMLKTFARSVGVPLIVLSPGLDGEGAFGVTPVPVGEKKNMRITYPQPNWTDTLEDADDEGIVFIDEITTAGPQMQAPLLGLLQQRMVGRHFLGDRVRVLAAGNPPEQAAGGWDLAAPVANRMGHFEWPAPTQAAWADYMLAKKVHRPGDVKGYGAPPAGQSLRDLEKLVFDGWEREYPRTAGLVTTFTNRRPALLHAMPETGNANASRAWPSHRSWDLAARVMTTAGILGIDEVATDLLIAGFVGSAVSTEFVAFRSSTDLPNPEDVLTGAVQFNHDPHRLDRTMAVLASCASLVAPEDAKDRDVRAAVLWNLMGTVLGTAMDTAVPAARMLSKAKLGQLKAATPVLVKLRPVLDAAGIKA